MARDDPPVEIGSKIGWNTSSEKRGAAIQPAFPYQPGFALKADSLLQRVERRRIMKPADVAVIGGGIVGLATAYQLTREHPGRRVVVLEKEADLAHHQTGHNSGVLHSGIYYKPGSLKAINCREGRLALIKFCQDEGVAHEICGKVIVALEERELPAMQRIFDRGQANGVKCETI